MCIYIYIYIYIYTWSCRCWSSLAASKMSNPHLRVNKTHFLRFLFCFSSIGTISIITIVVIISSSVMVIDIIIIITITTVVLPNLRAAHFESTCRTLVLSCCVTEKPAL